jgi:hypothetical protein
MGRSQIANLCSSEREGDLLGRTMSGTAGLTHDD